MVNFKEIYHFSRFQRGSNIFQGGGGSNFFQGGSNCLFPIETHITWDFPGGGGGGTDPLSPPLDPHLEKILGFFCMQLLQFFSDYFEILQVFRPWS